MRQPAKKSYAGFMPFAAVGIGAGGGGWIANFVGIPQWSLAVPGMIVGYFASRAVLRRIYTHD